MSSRDMKNSTTTFIQIIFACLIILATGYKSTAQLDNIHYLPPIKSTIINGNSLGQSQVILSTPSAVTISVTVTTGNGVPIVGSPFSVVNGSPSTITLALAFNALSLLDEETGIIQTDKGFILTSTDEFIVTYKAKSTNDIQTDVYTSKGQAALGTEFFWGGFPNTVAMNHKNAYLGIMATEDNTSITISGYDVNCVFRQGLVPNAITVNTILINLNAGESYVLECLSDQSSANVCGFIGAQILSDKNIAVNNGHSLGGDTDATAKDLMLEQAVSTDYIGTEHIVVSGNSSLNNLIIEKVIIIATQNNTDIAINGGATVANINAGEYYIIDGFNYSANNNMYIETSNPVYCYQQLRGASTKNTVGLNLIPPISCRMPKEIDEIPFIENNNGLIMSGGIFIITRSGATVLVNGSPPAALPQSVTGNTGWVSYKETGLTGNIKVTSTAPMAVGSITANGAAGSAGYYSGFVKFPEIQLTTIFNSSSAETCLDSISILDEFDSYQWLDGGIPVVGANDPSFQTFGEGIYSVAVDFNGCLDTSIQIISYCPIILAAELAYFIGDCSKIEWESITEINMSHYQIEESSDGYIWKQLGTNIESKGTGSYYSKMISSTSVNAVYYRLLSIDFNGVQKEHGIIAPDCFKLDEIIGVYTLSGQKVKLDEFSSSGVYFILYADQRVEKVFLN